MGRLARRARNVARSDGNSAWLFSDSHGGHFPNDEIAKSRPGHIQ